MWNVIEGYLLDDRAAESSRPSQSTLTVTQNAHCYMCKYEMKPDFDSGSMTIKYLRT